MNGMTLLSVETKQPNAAEVWAWFRQSGYDPAELHEVYEFAQAKKRERAAAIEAEAKAEIEAKPEEPKVETTDVETFVPWDFRVDSWLLRNVGLGSQDGVHDSMGRRLWLPRKLLVWAILAWPRFRRMLWIVRSGPGGDYTADERNLICEKCPSLKMDRKGYRRCGSCQCPDWILSRLHRKNGYAMNHCSEQRHPGEYIKLITHHYPNRKKPTKQKPARRGCGGNGHG
jgi:hypothetical protein